MPQYVRYLIEAFTVHELCRSRVGPVGSRTNAAIGSGQPWVATARKCVPSKSTNDPITAPHSVCAFSSIASNTGARSPGRR